MSEQRILITGSAGLIGSGVARELVHRGIEIQSLDIAEDHDGYGDVRDRVRVDAAIARCDGVVHLAAVSRVIWGEDDPALCRDTNINGTKNVLDAALRARRRPWVIFASSREVYGQPETLPANESCPLHPVNVYGETKIAGERLVAAAVDSGVRACIVRLSNVFGTTEDHADRVVPAFARQASRGEDLRVDGAGHTFDFTHVDDVARGLASLMDLLADGGIPPPPIHFVTGRPTTLGQLADRAIEIAGTGSMVRHAPPRSFDVARFYGDNTRARRLLGWSPRVELEAGLARLIADFRRLDADSKAGGA